MKQLQAGQSQIVSVGGVAKLYERSRPWARKLLATWFEEQQKGGPVRVFKQGKRGALYTTLAVLQQFMPPARDMRLVRTVERLERDLDFLARRCDALTARLQHLERQSARGRARQ